MAHQPLPCYRLHLLGRLEICDLQVGRGGDGRVPLRGMPLAVFAYLVAHRVPVSRTDLARLFWPDSDPARSRHGLRQALSRIRTTLGAEALVGQDPLSAPEALIATDLADLDDALREGGRFDEALGLWRGPFMAGIDDTGSWELQDEVASRRSELAARLGDAARVRVATLVELEDARAAREVVEQVLQRAPGQEALMLDLAEGLVRLGHPREALHWVERADAVEAIDRADAIRSRAEADLLEMPEPGELEDSDPPAEYAAPARPDRRRSPVGLALAGAAALTVLTLGSLASSAPSDARIWFCSERETIASLSMDLEGGDKHEAVAGAGCPVIPIGAGERAVTLHHSAEGAQVEVIGGDGPRPLLQAAGIFFSRPYRQAGLRDGILDPTGRFLVLTVEGAAAGALDGPTPGVAGASGEEGREWDVVVLDLESGSTENLGVPGARDFDGRFTAEGDAVVFVSERTGGGDLYRYDLASGALTRLTRDPRLERLPVVGRQGIVFVAGNGTTDPEQVRWLDGATGEVRTLDPASWNQVAPDLSPDETRVCWTDKEEGHWESEIRVASVDGGGSSPLTRSAGRDDYCLFLDDKTVIFRSWRTGDQEIFRKGLRWWSRPVNLSRYGAKDMEPVVVGMTGR